MGFDLVIRGGRIVDGSGGPSFEADVGVVDGRIVEIGRVRERGREEIDADGRVHRRRGDRGLVEAEEVDADGRRRRVRGGELLRRLEGLEVLPDLLELVEGLGELGAELRKVLFVLWRESRR